MKAALYRWLAASVGIGIGASAVLLLIVMLRLLLGPFDVLAGDGSPAESRVVLWEPASSQAQPEWQRVARRERWRALLPADARVEPSAELGTANVAIPADAAALSDAEVDELRGWIERGGSALLTGWVATGGAGGAMPQLLGVEHIRTLSPDESLFVAAGRRGPFSSGLLPGERVDLGAAAPSPALESDAAEIFWSDWALRARTPAAGASLRANRGRGRLAWLAFGPERAAQAAKELDALQRVFADALAWAEGEPSVELLAWPRGAPLAGLLAMDTEDQFANAQRVAARARADGFPVTFLVLTSLAKANAALLPELAATGEIGVHGDVHDGFAGQPADVQQRRLDAARAQLDALGVAHPDGFRAPYESYDETTLGVLPGAGFVYALGDNSAQSMAPRVLGAEGGPSLVQVPRIPQDDHDLLIRRGISDPALFRAIVLGEVELSARTSGLHYFSFHTQHFGDPERIDVIASLARELRARGAWLCTGRELARWWLERARIDVSALRTGPNRVHLNVTNRGTEPARGLALGLYANRALAGARASATALFREQPELTRDGERIVIQLPELPAGSSRDYALDLLPAEATTPSASSRAISASE